MRLVLATANEGKVAEIAHALGPEIDLIPRPSEVDVPAETGGSLVANARIKARAICDATGQPALADDTAFEIDALDGGPGVDGAYFAGPDASHADNCAKVISALVAVPHDQRGARYRTIALVALPDGGEIIAEGVCEGTIPHQVRGGGGFGYDSVFVPADGDGRTFAEMAREEKNLISHRAKAMTALKLTLREAAGNRH
jgi:XTP/dITP diphosphohydrolase